MRETALIRTLGRVDYEPTWRAMQDFTAGRGPDMPDEIWLLEHPPVFTLGMAGRREHLLTDIGIPVVPIDRGGQVTYHGPGQIVAYLLLDLRRRGYGVRELVRRIEQAVIDVLAGYGVAGERLAGAPGVYVGMASGGGVDGAVKSPPPSLYERGEQDRLAKGVAKIAALGLRVKNGCTYHGLALNVAMDLAPYRAINPCGYAGMTVTRLKDFVADVCQAEVETALARALVARIYSSPGLNRPE
jgi:lipoyl(octanoyl) transferase